MTIDIINGSDSDEGASYTFGDHLKNHAQRARNFGIDDNLEIIEPEHEGWPLWKTLALFVIVGIAPWIALGVWWIS